MPMQPGSPMAQMPAREDALIRKIQELERVQREMLPAVMELVGPMVTDLRAKQATLEAQDVTILGLIADLAAQQATLTDLIAKVVVPAPFYAASSNFAVSNTEWSVALEHSLTTPAGFSQAIVIANAWARIQNTSGGTAGFGALAQINGVSGPWDDQSTPVSQFGNLQATFATLVSGLTEGETIPIRTRVFSSPALSADPDNEATINGVVMWLR